MLTRIGLSNAIVPQHRPECPPGLHMLPGPPPASAERPQPASAAGSMEGAGQLVLPGRPYESEHGDHPERRTSLWHHGPPYLYHLI